MNITQSYHLNNKTIDLDLEKIPEFSGSSKTICANFEPTIPETFQTAKPLKDRVRSIEETARSLQEAKEHSTKNKIIALLKAASVVALVAAVSTVFVFGGEIGVAALMLGFFAYLFLTVILYCDAGSKIENIEQKLPNYSQPWFFPKLAEYDPRCFFPLLGGGLIMPVFEAFTRESRLEKVLKQQKASLETALSDYKTQNSETLPLAYQFFKEQSPKLLEALNSKIAALETTLNTLTQLPERTEAGENELKTLITNHQKARDELNAATEFYLKWD